METQFVRAEVAGIFAVDRTINIKRQGSAQCQESDSAHMRTPCGIIEPEAKPFVGATRHADKRPSVCTVIACHFRSHTENECT
jgi:hypothetical protein